VLIVTDEAAGVEVMGVLESSTSFPTGKYSMFPRTCGSHLTLPLKRVKFLSILNLLVKKIIEIEAVD